MLKILGLLAAVLLCAMMAPPASANTITYTYTGNPFTSTSGTIPLPSGVSSVTGSFTLNNPLGANFAGLVHTPPLLSFSFSDGASTVTQSNLIFGTIEIATDAAGSIAFWFIEFKGTVPSGGATTIFTFNCGSLVSGCSPSQHDGTSYALPMGGRHSPIISILRGPGLRPARLSLLNRRP